MRVEGRIKFLKCSWKVSLTISYCFNSLRPCQWKSNTKEQKQNQCCTRVCSRYWIMVDNTFHTSDHTDTTSPASSKTNGGGWQLSQRLLRAFLTAGTLPVGTPTAPQGKYSSLGETTAFPHQDRLHSISYKAVRADCGETWFLNVLYVHRDQIFFFPFLKEIQQRLSN